MSERSTPAGYENQDPPWPTMHPADAYDGSTGDTEDHDDGDGDGDDRRMHEQLKIANNEHTGEGPDGRPIPDDPERAVDAMDERVLGRPPEPEQDERENGTPAFDQDLDPEDQGSADAVARQAE